MTVNVLVYLELNNGEIELASKELVSFVKNNFEDANVLGAIATENPFILNNPDIFKNLPIEKIYLIRQDLFFQCESNIVATALAELIKDIMPDIFLVSATADGREIAPRVASKLNIGLTADCTNLELDDNNNLLATRPTYGGQMMATIYSKTKPNAATVRPGVFKYIPIEANKVPEIISYDVDLKHLANRIELLKSELIKAPEDWTNADVIVAGGLGLQTKENFELLYTLAEKINAKPAATRAVVERGWASQDIQVGQTGRTVSPKIYIAFGISGAMQHVVGITNSDKIISINTDETAPLMQLADIAIVEDAASILKCLINNSN